jgi:tetratricopeptide (TPR) repeat protein
VEAHINLGALYLEQNSAAMAVEQFEKAVELDSEAVDARLNLAYAREASGDTEGAVKDLEQTAKMDPQSPDPLLALGAMSLDAGDTAAALKYFLQAAQLDPGDPVTALNLANIYLQQKKTVLAVERLESVKDMDADGSMYAQAAVVLAKLKQNDAAIDLYQKAVKADPPYLKAYILMGNVYARSGNFKDAAGCFETFLKLSPDSEDAASAQKGLEVCRSKLDK